MKITVEQLQELIFEEEQIKKIAQTQSDRLGYDTSVELMERVMNALPISREENDRLIALIIQQVQDGEQGAFAQGLRIGKEFASWKENE